MQYRKLIGFILFQTGKPMKLVSITLLIIFNNIGYAYSNTEVEGKKCAAIREDNKRLLCYDLIHKIDNVTSPITKSTDTGQWRIQEDKSKIDDSRSVYLQLKSIDTFQPKYKSPLNVSLTLRCLENTTSVIFSFGGVFMSDNRGNGKVTFRIDDNEAFNKSLIESSDNQALGLWRGSSAIPFIKSLKNGKRLLIRFSPFNDSNYTVSFDTNGLNNAIFPLADACKWKF